MNKEMLHKLHAVNTNIFAQFLYKKFSILNYLFTCPYFAEVSNLHRKHAALTNHSRVKPLSIANESLSGVRTEFFFLIQTFQPLTDFTCLSKKRFVFTFPAENWQVEDKFPASIEPKPLLSIARQFSAASFSTSYGTRSFPFTLLSLLHLSFSADR